MEKLVLCALLITEGFDLYDEYGILLDRLFLQDPSQPGLMHLETLTSRNDRVAYTLAFIDEFPIDLDKFARLLVKQLQVMYKKLTLKSFVKHVNHMWRYIPQKLRYSHPFIIMCFADEALEKGNEKECRRRYEELLNYYSDK